MNPDVKAQWIEALRSGKYKQTQHLLHTNEGYCCLGVLCEITGLGGWEYEEFSDNTRSRYNYIIGDSSDPYGLPVPVLKYCDAENDLIFVLADMNDDGDSFDKIADWIEENL